MDYFTMNHVLTAFLTECGMKRDDFIFVNNGSSFARSIALYSKELKKNKKTVNLILDLFKFVTTNHLAKGCSLKPDNLTLCSTFNHIKCLPKRTIIPMGCCFIVDEELYYCSVLAVSGESDSITNVDAVDALLFMCEKLESDDDVTKLFTNILKDSFFETAPSSYVPTNDPVTRSWIYGVAKCTDSTIGVTMSLDIKNNDALIGAHNIQECIPEDYLTLETLKLATKRAMYDGQHRLCLWDARIRLIKSNYLIKLFNYLVFERITYTFYFHLQKKFKKYMKHFRGPAFKMEF